MSTEIRWVRLLAAAFALLVGMLSQPSPAQAQVPLGSEFQINSYTTSAQESSAIASDALGNFVVVWSSDDQDGDREGVFGQRYDASGSPLGEEFQVNTFTRGPQRKPAVAPAGSGGFVVVWENNTAGYRQILGQRFDADGTPLGGEFRVDTALGGYPREAAVASDPLGGFVVVWDHNDVGGGIFARRYDGSGSPIGSSFQVNSYLTGLHDDPDVSVDEAGNFVAVWTAADIGSTTSIFGQRFDAAGSPRGEEFRVSRNTLFDEIDSSVASTDGGGFVVVWEQTHSVLGQLFGSSGYPVGGEFQVNTVTFLGDVPPDVSRDEEGNFIVVYAGLGQAFNADGSRRGGEFQTHSNVRGQFSHPQIAIHAEGDFVVSWTKPDGSDSGVFGRRFAGGGVSLTIDGSCPGPVTAQVSNAPPGSEVAVIASANLNGFVKGGTLCAGTELAIGEPLQLPPAFVIVDENGNGSRNLVLGTLRCRVQALALASCETSNVVTPP
jgi:hypothetical protein